MFNIFSKFFKKKKDSLQLEKTLPISEKTRAKIEENYQRFSKETSWRRLPHGLFDEKIFKDNFFQLYSILLNSPTSHPFFKMMLSENRNFPFHHFYLLSCFYHLRKNNLEDFSFSYDFYQNIVPEEREARDSSSGLYSNIYLSGIYPLLSFLFATELPVFWLSIFYSLHFYVSSDGDHMSSILKIIEAFIKKESPEEKIRLYLNLMKIEKISRVEIHLMNNYAINYPRISQQNWHNLPLSLPSIKIPEKIREELDKNKKLSEADFLKKAEKILKMDLVYLNGIGKYKDLTKESILKMEEFSLPFINTKINFIYIMILALNISDDFKWQLLTENYFRSFFPKMIADFLADKDFWISTFLHYDHAVKDKDNFQDFFDFLIDKRYREDDKNYSIKTKGAAAIKRDIDSWHLELAKKQAGYKENETWELSSFHSLTEDEVTIIEINSSYQLFLEGMQQKHCVFSYLSPIKKSRGTHTVWSLTIADKKHATIEVHNNQIVQIRGKFNARIEDPRALKIINDWKTLNNFNDYERRAL